jgi:hypothetical protein
MTTPTLTTSCVALDESLPEAATLRPVQNCIGSFGAAGLSPEGVRCIPKGCLSGGSK